ncbi:MAG: hypothetical protein K6A33_08550, partial [Clostridiales bacterium]|nr:hypothetical protein [Clostridiales bacterium]
MRRFSFFARERREGFAVHPACALTFAGMFSEITRFFVLPDGTQEASAASLLGITAAQGLSRLGNPPC